MLGAFTVNVEIVGTCNLTCPSCPVGSYGASRKDPLSGGSIGGTMTLDRFRSVLDWLVREVKPRHEDVFVALFSWGEPLIHPKVGEMVTLARAAGFRVGLSSNLNHAPHLEAAVKAGPDEFVVSLSGFDQDTYVQSHRGGNIEVVKANMVELSRLMEVHGSTTKVFVHYHGYRHNSGSDYVRMAELADALRFHFIPSIAYLMPVEKMLAAAQHETSPADQPIIDRLLIPISDQLEAARAAMGAHETCDLIESRLDIDVDGAVKLCCSSYERRHNVAPKLEDVVLDTIQARRHQAALCGPCMENGIHRIYNRSDYADSARRADRALAALGSPVRFAAAMGEGAPQTEQILLDRVLRTMNAGELQEARALLLALHGLIERKYHLAAPLEESILARVEKGEALLGVTLPQDPARLLFASAVLARNLNADARGSHSILLAIDKLLRHLDTDRSYRTTIVDMRRIIDEWLTLPVP